MSFLTHQISRAGGRSANQDAADHRQAGGVACWVLADGLGGHDGGEVASAVAVEAVGAAFEARPEGTAEAVQALAAAAQAALHARQDAEPDLDGMRTTLVVLLADGREARWGHVGDSRLYAFRQGRLVRQTRDHSVSQALAAAGEIGPEEVRHHADRNQLLRSLGQPGVVPVEVEEAPFALGPGDAFLLCSDGFWEAVGELEMEADLAKADHPEAWLTLMEDRLLARLEPGHDNYSAVGVFVTA